MGHAVVTFSEIFLVCFVPTASEIIGRKRFRMFIMTVAVCF